MFTLNFTLCKFYEFCWDNINALTFFSQRKKNVREYFWGNYNFFSGQWSAIDFLDFENNKITTYLYINSCVNL